MNTKLALLIVLSASATSACWLGSDAELAEMTLQRLSGRVSIERDGERIEVPDEMAIQPGDLVTTASGPSRARLRLAGSFRIELAPSSSLEVLGPTAVRGRSGELLGSTTDRISLRFGQARAVTSDALFRVDLGAGSARAGVYRGSLTLSAPGQGNTQLDALYQATVAAYSRVLQPAPLSISVADRWDRVNLAEIFELDDRLERLGAGLATQLGGQRPGVDYFSSLAKRDISFMKRYLRHSVPDLLIGFTIARGSKGSLRAALGDTFSLFDQGARWGLVARILEVKSDPLVAQLRRLVAATGVLAGPDATGPAFTAAGAPSIEPAAPGAPPTSNGDGDGGDGDDPGSGGGGPSGEPTPPPDDECDPTQNPTCLLPLPSPSSSGSGGGLLDGEGP